MRNPGTRNGLNLVAKRNWFYLFSFLIMVPGIISLLIPPRLQPGIGERNTFGRLATSLGQCTWRGNRTAYGEREAHP